VSERNGRTEPKEEATASIDAALCVRRRCEKGVAQRCMRNPTNARVRDREVERNDAN